MCVCILFGLELFDLFRKFFSFFLLETEPPFKTFRLCYGDMWFAGGILAAGLLSPYLIHFPFLFPPENSKKKQTK